MCGWILINRSMGMRLQFSNYFMKQSDDQSIGGRIIEYSLDGIPFLAVEPPTMRFVITFECPHPSCGVSKRPLIVGIANGFDADSTCPPVSKIPKKANWNCLVTIDQVSKLKLFVIKILTIWNYCYSNKHKTQYNKPHVNHFSVVKSNISAPYLNDLG